MVADHISRILVEHTIDIDEVKEKFFDEQLFTISSSHPPWFAHIVNYLAKMHMNSVVIACDASKQKIFREKI